MSWRHWSWSKYKIVNSRVLWLAKHGWKSICIQGFGQSQESHVGGYWTSWKSWDIKLASTEAFHSKRPPLRFCGLGHQFHNLLKTRVFQRNLGSNIKKILQVVLQFDQLGWVDHLLMWVIRAEAKRSSIALKCNEYGHISSKCRNREIHVTEWEEESNTPSYVADYDQPEFDWFGTDDDTIYGDRGQSLMIHKTLFSPKTPTKDDWLCTSIFCTTCIIKDCKCHLIVDGGSCKNVVITGSRRQAQTPNKKASDTVQAIMVQARQWGTSYL